MSDPTAPPVSRPLLIALAATLVLAALYGLWVLVAQPLFAPDDPIVDAEPVPIVPVPTVTPTPTPDGHIQGADDLLVLGEVGAESFILAGARDPFRQVIVEAEVDDPDAVTDGSTVPAPAPPAPAPPAPAPAPPGPAPAPPAPAPAPPAPPGPAPAPGPPAPPDPGSDDTDDQFGTPTPAPEAGPEGIDAIADTGAPAAMLARVSLGLLTLGALLLTTPGRRRRA
jgi:hypothetical protein